MVINKSNAFKKTEKIKIGAKNIINMRNSLSKDMTYYWKIIKNENIMAPEMKRNFDLNAVYSSIIAKSEQRVKTKMLIQAINMGYSIFDLEKFETETNYKNIYELSEKNELFVQLGLIKTLKKPKDKTKTVSKKTEIFTAAKIRALKKKLQLEINKLTKAIEDFNTNAEIEVDISYGWLLAA